MGHKLKGVFHIFIYMSNNIVVAYPAGSAMNRDGGSLTSTGAPSEFL